MRKVPWTAFVVVAIVAVIAGLVLWLRGTREQRIDHDVARLRARHAVLHDSLARMMQRDPLIALASIDSSQISVALSETLLVNTLQRVATQYLDRVELDLSNVRGHGDGEFDVETPVGQLTVGEWSVKVVAHEIAGVLSAATPTATFSSTNRIHLAMPVTISEGTGSVTLAFKWNSRSVFNIVCRDFETVQKIDGIILPQQHVVRGDMVLEAGDDGITATPDFPRVKYPLAMTLTDASWDRVRKAFQEQDKLFKCGLMLNPDSAVARLRTLGMKGLRFRLPRAAFRTIVLPTSIKRSVRILNAPVELAVAPNRLRVTPGMFWYSARVSARRSAGLDSLLPWPAGAK